MKPKAIYWVSLVTYNKYKCNKYTNHGYGDIKNGYKDLPKEEYPYTLIYKQNIKSLRR